MRTVIDFFKMLYGTVRCWALNRRGDVTPLMLEDARASVPEPGPHDLPAPQEFPQPRKSPQPLPLDSASNALEDEGVVPLGERYRLPNRIDEESARNISAALREWHAALSYFESVSDPDLVDFAVYDIEAAKRRYLYLLKCAKQEQQPQRQLSSTLFIHSAALKA